MTGLWFATGAPPRIDYPNATNEYRALADGDTVWAVLQQPVQPQQLRRAVEWELMPESLLRDFESLSSAANIGTSPVLLKGVDFDLPFDVQGYVLDGHIGHVTVAGTLLLAYRMVFEHTHADVLVVDERWSLVVHPADESADLIEWRG